MGIGKPCIRILRRKRKLYLPSVRRKDSAGYAAHRWTSPSRNTVPRSVPTKHTKQEEGNTARGNGKRGGSKMRKFEVPEHPDVAWIEATGYPPDEQEVDPWGYDSYDECRERELFGD
jgi:hypothetical protein